MAVSATVVAGRGQGAGEEALALAGGPAPDDGQAEEAGPVERVAVLVAVKAVAKVDAIHELVVGADTGEQVPPAVTLGGEAPRHANAAAPGTELAAKRVVNRPQGDASQEHADSPDHHAPHAVDHGRVDGTQPALHQPERA